MKASKNFAKREIGHPTALGLPGDLSVVQRLYKNRGGHTSSFHLLPTPPDQCTGPAALVPCSPLPPIPAAASVFVALAPIAAEPSSAGTAVPAHCRHHQSRAPVMSPLSVSCTRAPVIRALSLLPSPDPPCARAVHSHS